MTAAAGFVVRSAEATGVPSDIGTGESRHETVFEFLLRLWLSHIMQWVMDVEGLRRGERKGHPVVLSDQDRPGGELVEHLVEDD